MGLVRTVDPTIEPITRAEAKDHSRVTTSKDDAYIDGLIAASRARIEGYCKRALLTQTWQLTLDRWPRWRRGYGSDIILPWPNLLTVSSITYVDTVGTTQTWDSANYVADTAATPGRVRLAYGEIYPSARHEPNAITITYTAGFGPAATDLPSDLVHACKILVGHWYDNREPVVTGTVAAPIPETYKALLAPWRVLGGWAA